jgi:hypothetical protein
MDYREIASHDVTNALGYIPLSGLSGVDASAATVVTTGGSVITIATLAADVAALESAGSGVTLSAITALQTRATVDETAITALQTRATTDETAITALQHRASADEAEIAALATSIASLEAGGGGGTSGAYVPLAGGAMTGLLTLSGNASAPLNPVSLQQMTAAITVVDDAIAAIGTSGSYVPLAGGAMTGPLLLSGAATASLGAVTLAQLTAAIAAIPSGGGGIIGGGTYGAPSLSAMTTLASFGSAFENTDGTISLSLLSNPAYSEILVSPITTPTSAWSASMIATPITLGTPNGCVVLVLQPATGSELLEMRYDGATIEIGYTYGASWALLNTVAGFTGTASHAVTVASGGTVGMSTKFDGINLQFYFSTNSGLNWTFLGQVAVALLSGYGMSSFNNAGFGLACTISGGFTITATVNNFDITAP